MESKQILMVDDDVELCELLGDYLSHEGYQLSFAHDSEQALELLRSPNRFALMVLDIMMPGKTGLDLLQQIRPSLSLPVILLTGRGGEIDRILGLEMGADDYLPKPCNPRELLARIRAILRRSNAVEAQAVLPNHPLVVGDIFLDARVREVRAKTTPLELTSAEFNVLAYLLANAGQVVSKEQLSQWVLHRKLGAYDRAIDVHVSRVRQKLAQVLGDKEYIKTLRGAGYQLLKEVS